MSSAKSLRKQQKLAKKRAPGPGGAVVAAEPLRLRPDWQAKPTKSEQRRDAARRVALMKKMSLTMPRCGQCHGKVAYADQRTALFALEELHRGHPYAEDGALPHRAYRCPHGFGWHLTRSPDRAAGEAGPAGSPGGPLGRQLGRPAGRPLGEPLDGPGDRLLDGPGD